MRDGKMGLSGHELRLTRSGHEAVADLERFLGRALAGTTEVLASSMPSGSNAGNGHVRIKRPNPVLAGNS